MHDYICKESTHVTKLVAIWKGGIGSMVTPSLIIDRVSQSL